MTGEVRARTLLLAGALGLLALFLSASRAGNPRWGGGRSSFPPRVVSGDEPHYLLGTNALLQGDGFCLRRAYLRVQAGSWDAGQRFVGVTLDHHTLLVIPGRSGPVHWSEAYRSEVPRACASSGCTPFAPVSTDFDNVAGLCEVSSHPLAFPLLTWTLVRPFATAPEAVERVAITWMALLGWLATLAVHGAGRASGFSRSAAIAAALVCGLASPVLAYGRAFFPEVVIGCALAVASWLYFRGRLALAGAACALAFALKPPFALAGAGLLLDRMLAREWRQALRLGAPLAAGAALVLGMNQVVAHTPLISGTTPWRWASTLEPLEATVLGPSTGLLRFAPWAALALWAAVAALPRPNTPGALPRAGPALGPALLAYLVLLALRADNAGDCWGPRYWVGFCPWLALLAVDFARRGGQLRRLLLAVLVVWAIPISVAGAFRYSSVWGRTPGETVRAQWPALARPR